MHWSLRSLQNLGKGEFQAKFRRSLFSLVDWITRCFVFIVQDLYWKPRFGGNLHVCISPALV